MVSQKQVGLTFPQVYIYLVPVLPINISTYYLYRGTLHKDTLIKRDITEIFLTIHLNTMRRKIEQLYQ